MICLQVPPLYIYKGKLSSFIQKQSFRGVLRKRCSGNMQQIYRRTPMPKCISKKLLALRRGYFPVNLLHISRTPFPKNTSGGLLLFIVKKMLIETGIKEVCVLKGFLILFVFGFLFTIIKTKYDLLWSRKCSLKLDYVI